MPTVTSFTVTSHGTCAHCERDQTNPEHPEYAVTIGVEVQCVYDGSLFWQCPYCGGRWHCWSEGTRQHALAVPYVAAGPGKKEG